MSSQEINNEYFDPECGYLAPYPEGGAGDIYYIPESVHNLIIGIDKDDNSTEEDENKDDKNDDKDKDDTKDNKDS